MVALLRDSNEDVRKNAALAIHNLSDLPLAKAEFVAALVKDIDLLKVRGSGGLVLIDGWSSARSFSPRTPDGDPVTSQSVFGADSAAPLCELLESKDVEMRAAATVAFEWFCVGPREGRDKVVNTLHVVPRLLERFVDEEFDNMQRKSAGNALQRLCSTYPDAVRVVVRFAGNVVASFGSSLALTSSRGVRVWDVYSSTR